MKHLRSITVVAISAAIALSSACANKTTQQPSETKAGPRESTAPAGTEAKQAEKALVRFANATRTPKDLYFGDSAAFRQTGFKTVTPYQELPAERHDFKLMAAGNPAEVLATNSEGLTAGKHYTILAVDQKDGKPALNAINDDLAPPTAGKAKVRVINAAPGLDDLDLYAANQKNALISGAGFNHATDYKDVEPTTTQLMVRHGTSKRGEAVLKNLRLEAGKLYTLLVVGGRGQTLTAETIEDQLAGVPPRS